ncbi:hypothetical protein SAMN05216262_12912 [Colwellia chukchiensis]|uniref:Cytochrome c-type biogenesis protein H Ig-like domain-containing protein n=1 Tax=Colwellia chukchiensis TaxID=641665 RepID=A0A1H7TWY5_9GAMM|nr:hypothetical protein [Colwellia chukchiensis]SEL88457.1 hypothetical protein SAMN05216262_12912 [Colwellia chukchiensis]
MRKILLLTSALLVCLLMPNLTQAETKVTKQASRSIHVQLDIASDLMPEDADDWVLYVYATKPGTRLPLANFKGKLSQLPSEIALHQSMYLLPHLTLQQAERVVVVAKATKSKNPHQKSADDLIGYSASVDFQSGPAQSVTMIIDQHDKVVIEK